MANAEAMRLSNKAVWGDSVLDALSYYTANSRGVTYEFRKNNMSRHNIGVTYQIDAVENGFVLSLPEMQYGTTKRFVFNALAELNDFLADNNQVVFIK